MKASGSSAVMASRREPPDALDDFPTPPWATRALCLSVLPRLGVALGTVWEPACNRGLMAEALKEYATAVIASDIFDYGYGAAPVDFLSDPPLCTWRPDWIITNPPFNKAMDFALQAFEPARAGVALLCRSNWAEGVGRWALFRDHPPAAIAQFAERVPMVKGRWDPRAKSATAYAWFVWLRGSADETRFLWIPPGQRERLTWSDDVARFAPVTDAPLLPEHWRHAEGAP